MASSGNRPDLPPRPAVIPNEDSLDRESLRNELRIVQEAKRRDSEREEEIQALLHRRASRAPTSQTQARDHGDFMHYISVVKQEPGISLPSKRKKSSEVIDLCDSDSDVPEERAPFKPSATGSSSTAPTPQARPLDESTPRSNSDVGIVPELSTATLSNDATVVPIAPVAETLAAPRSYWQRRPDPVSHTESTLTPTTMAAAAGPSTSRPVPSPATVAVMTAASSKPKNARKKPEPEHPHKYRGPELTILSPEAIFEHLDRAWGRGKANATTIRDLSGWWNPSAVTFAHQLDKHQIWLLLFAETQWWKALERQWSKYDALPSEGQSLIVRIMEARLKKESKAATAEVAMAIERRTKNPDAVYLLANGVKKEKVDKKDIGKNNRDNEKFECVVGRAEDSEKAGEVIAGGGVKQVRFGTINFIGEEGATNKGKKRHSAKETDDGLSSDSEEEED